jgi:cytidylate kinase
MITIITGSPGSGKTTVSEYLAARTEKGVHIPSDLFYSFIPHRIAPNLAEADSQNRAVIGAVMKAALEYSRGGYDVFVDGIFGPWFVSHIAALLRGAELTFHYVILDISVAEAIQRIQRREDSLEEGIIRQMNAEFKTRSQGFETHLVDVGKKEISDLAQEILWKRDQGNWQVVTSTIP